MKSRTWALSLLIALLAPIGCSSLTGCDEETMEFRDTDIRPQVANYENNGWDCDLISSRPDPIFGIATIRNWKCTRCK